MPLPPRNPAARPAPPAASSSRSSSPATRAHRRQRIADLVRERKIESQFDLQDLLAEEGIVVNQATLSRDLRAMGLLKGPAGYELPSDLPAEQIDKSVELFNAVHGWLSQATTAENLVVLRTPAGGANPLALALDHAQWREVLGTIAGDDTILVVTKSPTEARRVAKALLDLKEKKRK